MARRNNSCSFRESLPEFITGVSGSELTVGQPKRYLQLIQHLVHVQTNSLTPRRNQILKTTFFFFRVVKFANTFLNIKAIRSG